MASAARVTVGLIGTDLEAGVRCADALSGMADFMLLPWEVRLREIEPPALLLLTLAPPHAEKVRHLVRYRQERPVLPVLLLGAGLGPDQAVELMLCSGAADYLSLPPEPTALRRKVERALQCGWQPAFDGPLFAPFTTSSSSGRLGNQRRAFRAAVPPWLEGTALFATEGRELVLRLEDLSITVDGFHGGMSLLADARSTAALPLGSFWVGDSFLLNLRLSTEPETLTVRARIMRVERTIVGGVRMGVLYEPRDPASQKRLQRFWADCQRPNPAA